MTDALLLSGYQLWRYYSAEHEAAGQFDDLTEQIQTPALQPLTESPDRTESPPEWTATDQHRTLFEQNPEMIGWIAPPGTAIDYPVMQSPARPNFCLNHGFDGKVSDYGVPYADKHCSIDPPSDNITLYGHHMKSGKMFGALESYKSKGFYLDRPIIHFDTRAGFGQYETFAVLAVNPADFPHHQFVNTTDQAAFDKYVTRCKALSLYDTVVSAKYGDKLITLSTC
ncbi:MAG: class B sortase [Christensenellales bacterium]